MNEVLHPEGDVVAMDRDDPDAEVVASLADEHSSQEILHRIVVVGGGAAGAEAHLTGDLEQKPTGFKTQTTRRWPRPPACAGSGSKTRAKVEGGDWRWRRGSLFTMVEAVMSGRGAEPIDLVRTNLWR
jgi:hypothetical protein